MTVYFKNENNNIIIIDITVICTLHYNMCIIHFGALVDPGYMHVYAVGT
jgi:hypothetical protein